MPGEIVIPEEILLRVAGMWSGGKDSYLACQEAILKGFSVTSLVNFKWKEVENSKPSIVTSLMSSVLKRVSISKPYKYVPHEVNPEIIALQAQAMEIPIVQPEVSWATFEDQFKTTIRKLEPAVEGVVWGAEGGQASVHMDRLRQISDELGVKMIIPLAGKSEEQNLEDFTQKGFEATIIVVDSDLLSEEWLGQKVDANFLQTIRRRSKETGVAVGNIEFHTLVTDAPLFKKRLQVLKSMRVSRKGFSVLDISKAELIVKTETNKDAYS